MNNYRILANPLYLASEKIKGNTKISFQDKLKEIILNEYSNIYIPQNIHEKINLSIQNHINNLVIDQTINEILNSIIEKVITESKDKKFDFCLPFD